MDLKMLLQSWRLQQGIQSQNSAVVFNCICQSFFQSIATQPLIHHQDNSDEESNVQNEDKKAEETTGNGWQLVKASFVQKYIIFSVWSFLLNWLLLVIHFRLLQENFLLNHSNRAWWVSSSRPRILFKWSCWNFKSFDKSEDIREQLSFWENFKLFSKHILQTEETMNLNRHCLYLPSSLLLETLPRESEKSLKLVWKIADSSEENSLTIKSLIITTVNQWPNSLIQI